MRKMILLSSVFLFLCTLRAQTLYDSTCFESDFTGAGLPAGVTIEVESGTYSIQDGALTGTYTDLPNWKCALKLKFDTPIDLSDNADFIIKLSSTEITPSPELRIRLSDTTEKFSSDWWDARVVVNSDGELITKSIDFSNTDFIGELDLSRVNYVECMVSNGGPCSGSIRYDYIKLGAKKEPVKEYYSDNFNGTDLSDENVTFKVDGRDSYTVADGCLTFQLKDNPGWGQVFEFAFTNPIDIRKDPTLELQFTQEGTGAFQARLTDAAGAATGDDNNAVFWGNDTKDFSSQSEAVDLSKIKYIRFYDKGLTGGTSISIDAIRIGKEPLSGLFTSGKETECSVFPSVTDDYLQIKTSLNNFTVSVYNMAGAMVWKAGHETVINVSSLEKGVYFLRINETGECAKFIKR